MGRQCTPAGKSADAPDAEMCSPAPQRAGFLARAAAALVGEDCRVALSPWAAGWNTAVTPAVAAPSQRAAYSYGLDVCWVGEPGL